jgi:surfactin synthase thioesterase subunit
VEAVTAPRWLVGKPSPAATLRLYCFPHGGGTAADYVRWAPAMPGIDVRGVQLPGRGTRLREPPFTDMDSLVSAIACEVDFEPPFAFFGHSLGALVAYEVARALRRADRDLPAVLFLSGFPAPDLPRHAPPVHHLPDDELLAEIERRHEAVPAEVLNDPALRAMAAPVLRADFEVLETYVHRAEPPLPCAISVLAGADEPIPAEALDGWQRHTTPPVAVRRFPGGHFYLRDQRDAVLRTLGAELRGAVRADAA